jgi:phosphoribosylamine-glycine ligase
MTTEREFKEKIIAAAEKAIVELILVAKEPIIGGGAETDLSADKLKNAAATKKLAIMDAFETKKGFAERFSK